jgi:hypothetical protein
MAYYGIAMPLWVMPRNKKKKQKRSHISIKWVVTILHLEDRQTISVPIKDGLYLFINNCIFLTTPVTRVLLCI